MTIRQTLVEPCRRFLEEESGPAAVEYAVMLAMILAVVIVTIQQLGTSQNSFWGNIDSEMQAHGIN